MQTLQLKIAQNSVAYVRLAANGNVPDSTVRLGWIGLRFGLNALRFGLGTVWFWAGYAGRMAVPATFVLV